MRAVAAVQHLWPRLADGSVIVSRDQLELCVATDAGIDSSAVSRSSGTRRAPGIARPEGSGVESGGAGGAAYRAEDAREVGFSVHGCQRGRPSVSPVSADRIRSRRHGWPPPLPALTSGLVGLAVEARRAAVAERHRGGGL